MGSVSIPLKSRKHPGLFAIVDEEDYPLVSQYRWGVIKSTGCYVYYATASLQQNRQRTRLIMHRVILNAPPDTDIDHIDGDGLNNRRTNLRFATVSQNNMNQRIRTDNKSGYRGVSWDSNKGRWRADISANRSKRRIGRYDSAEDAARAYDAAARRLHGQFARLNFPDENKPPTSGLRPIRISASGVCGVYRQKNGRWYPYVDQNGKRHGAGGYASLEEAVAARNRKIAELAGDSG